MADRLTIDAFNRVLADAGVDVPPDDFTKTQDHKRTTGLMISCPAQVTLGGERLIEIVQQSNDEIRIKAAKRLAGRYAREELRLKAIKNAGGDPLHPPAWALKTQAVLALAMNDLGALGNLSASKGKTNERGLGINYVPGEEKRFHVHQGFACGEEVIVDNVFFKQGFTIFNNGKVMLQIDGPREISDTILTAMRGMTIGQVVNQPAFKNAPDKIDHVRKALRTLDIRLVRNWVRLAPIPEGIDRSWTDTIASVKDFK